MQLLESSADDTQWRNESTCNRTSVPQKYPRIQSTDRAMILLKSFQRFHTI